jgi:hypothetical protein
MAASHIHISNKYRVSEMATRNPNLYSTSHQVIQTLRTYQRLCVTGKAKANLIAAMSLPRGWTTFLHNLRKHDTFDSSNQLGKLITFACEYKCGQHTAAAHQLALYLYST